MSWLQLRLAITPDQAPFYEEALLQLGALSVTFMDAEDQPIFEPELGTTPLWRHTHLLALFAEEAVAPSLLDHLQSLTGQPLPEHCVEAVEDQDWERSWMDNFQPLRFGNRLWIVPSWYEAPDPEAVNLLLDPGLAFGTGTHPTTALCLQWLDSQPVDGCTVLDFGCGSGILAIAALLLGAAQAIGTDIDPQALQASRENARRNGIDDRSLILRQPAELADTPNDIVIANILAGPLISLAEELTTRTRSGGRLVLSGILAEQADEICRAYEAHFRLDPIVEKDGWVRISGTRRV